MFRSAASVLTKTGEAFLPAVVQEVVHVFDANVTVVAELVGGERLQTVSVWRDGAPAKDFEFPIAETPCQDLHKRMPISFGANVKTLFPADPLLASIEVATYIAVPLIGTRDEVVGAMIVITPRDLGKDPHEVGLLDLLASRVAGEIERLHAERDLQRSQEQLQAIQRVEAIGTLAGHIAHDFNNLLTIVIGYGEVLQERTPSQEVSELLAAAKRASTLTRQLLAFGRRQMMQVQRVDLNKVVMQVQAMLTGAMGTQIRLSTTLEPRLPQVEVDPGQLEQVLVNLAINATLCRKAARCTSTRRRWTSVVRTSRCRPGATCASRSATQGQVCRPRSSRTSSSLSSPQKGARERDSACRACTAS